MMPVILAVSTDDTKRTALAEVLQLRFSSGYTVTVEDDPADALRQLAEYRDAGEEVALVLAPFHMTDRDGIPFLIEAHALHPTARRVLVLNVGDVTAADDLSQALTLNQVDFYFGQPWASPEEEVYPVLADALRVWARDHQPRFEKAVIMDVTNGTRGAQLRGWLERNTVAATLLAADSARARTLLAEHGVKADRLPVAVLYNGAVLVDPTQDELAEALGARTRPMHDQYDVAIVGAGPAGLAAAVYAGSEGLRAIMIEYDAVGGQAGTSAKIRNYLGFPWGVSGNELTERASRQAEQLGTETIVARQAEGLRAEGSDRVVTLSSGDEVKATTIVLAAGVIYRRLDVPAVDALVGEGGVLWRGSVGGAVDGRAQRVRTRRRQLGGPGGRVSR